MFSTSRVLAVAVLASFLASGALGQGEDPYAGPWKLKCTFPVDDQALNVRFHPKDDHILVADSAYTMVTMWDVAQGKALGDRQQGGGVSDISWNQEGDRLAVATYGGTANVWSYPEGELVAPLRHGCEVLRLAFSPNGEFLATIPNGRDWTLRIWHVSTGQEVAAFRSDLPFTGRPTFSSDNRFVAAGNGRGSTGRVFVAEFKEVPQQAGVSPLGPRRAQSAEAVTSPSRRIPSTQPIPLPTSGKWVECGVINGFAWEVQELMFVPGSYQLIAGGSTDGSVRLFDLNATFPPITLPPQQRKRKKVVQGGGVVPALCMAVSADGKCIASVAAQGEWVCRISPGQSFEVFALERRNAPEGMAFSPGGKYLATSGGTVVVWDVSGVRTKGRSIQYLPGEVKAKGGVAFSESGRYLTSGGEDQVTVWENTEYEEAEEATVEVAAPTRVRK